ncbi:hypothetical protein Acr_21g0000480 [Actinidia rufa]|uniref:Uncharacterized protein n=1 Tax=Actinidia rufa TaxID=165716 RepID=A0A7J0GF82_9ERIC|nr:hypothetical protein Acr_21g0000480 [Actinidia rufa]
MEVHSSTSALCDHMRFHSYPCRDFPPPPRAVVFNSDDAEVGSEFAGPDGREKR